MSNPFFLRASIYPLNLITIPEFHWVVKKNISLLIPEQLMAA